MSAGFFWSGADDPYPAEPRVVRRRRWRGAFFAALWLTPLAGTYMFAVHHHHWLAVVSLTVFVGLYLATLVAAFARQAADPGVGDQLLLAGTTLVGAGLVIGYAGSG